METIVISDTSCLIILALLKLAYSSVVVTPDVAAEFGRTLPEIVHLCGFWKNQLTREKPVPLRWLWKFPSVI